MSKPISPNQSLANWSSTIGKDSLRFGTLKTAKQLEARVKLAYMAGFDAGTKAEHHRVLKQRKDKA
jgi:hypothetical protein